MRRGALLGLLAGVVLAQLARARLDVVEVRGRSMAPTLVPGDRLIVVRGRPRPGRIVLASDPRDPRRELVKRVARVGGGDVWLSGDNPSRSTDARTFGSVSADAIRWTAVARYWPPDRVGVLRSTRVSPPPDPVRSRPGATRSPRS